MSGAFGLVVPGHSRRGSVSARCRRLLELAAELAEQRQPRVVVFTGKGPARGLAEAEQMVAAWPGRRDVELLAEPTARITAENMSRSLPLLLERGVTDAAVVCAPLHSDRVHYFFGGVYPAYGIRCEVVVAKFRRTPAALAWELGAARLKQRQLQAALAELDGLAHA